MPPFREEAASHVGDVLLKAPVVSRLRTAILLPLLHRRSLALAAVLPPHLDGGCGPAGQQAPERACSGVEVGVIGMDCKHERTSTRQVLDCGAIVETSAANVVLACVFKHVLCSCAGFAPRCTALVKLIADLIEFSFPHERNLAWHAQVIWMLLERRIADVLWQGQGGN